MKTTILAAALTFAAIPAFSETEIRATGREQQVGGAHERPTPLGEHLVEAAEDRVAGHAHEEQPVLLFRQGSDAVLFNLVF